MTGGIRAIFAKVSQIDFRQVTTRLILMAHTVLIKNGRLIDPASGLDGRLDVLVKEGKIAQVAPNISAQDGAETIDASGKIVAPGLIDCHVHLRDFEEGKKETIITGTGAAASGGLTAVICEPNTRPPIDSYERVEELKRLTEQGGVVRVYAKAALTKGMWQEKPTDIEALSSHPMVVALSEDGNPIVEEALMKELSGLAASCKIPLSLHCEDSRFSCSRLLQKGRQSRYVGFKPGSDYQNEPNFISRDIKLAEEAGAQVHISHVSLKESVEIIHRAKARGVNVTCEVAPHHLFLEEGSRWPDGLPIKVNPPLRPKEDCEALITALNEGIIDVIASDHAPHAEEDRKGGAPGLIGLETTLGLVLTRLVHPGIVSLMDAVKMLSTNPASIFHIEGGSLRVGMPGDITIIDLEREWVVDTASFESLSRNCPFEGWRQRGKAVLTMVGGRVVMRAGDVVPC